MARKERYLVGLDVGTSKVTVIVGEVMDEGGLDIIGICIAESKGIRRGVVNNVDSAAEAIKRALDEAELTAGVEIDSGYVKVVRLFGASRLQLFRLVILPGSFPVIIATLKVNVGLAWVGVIVGEFLVAKIGLGYQIIYGFQVFNFTLVLSSLVVIGVVATVMYQLVAWLEKRLTEGWRER